MIGLKNPRTPWLWLYVFVNVMATWIMLDTGGLVGDVMGNDLHNEQALLVAAVLVVLSYLIILGPLFNWIEKFRVAPIEAQVPERDIGIRIGQVILVLQIAFLLFNMANGVNVAGSASVKAESAFSSLWALIPADALFVIYYGVYRDNKYFKINFAVWFISNIIRGWSGVFFFILFFEWCRAVRGKKISMKAIAIVVVMVLVMYPVIMNMKWVFRAAARPDFHLGDTVSAIVDEVSASEYMTLVSDGVSHLVGRLQVTSMVTEVIRMRDLLQEEYAANRFAPYWYDGVHANGLDRMLGQPKSHAIGVAFTEYGRFQSTAANVGDWNTNIGYVGWFFIAPLQAPLYIAFTLGICFLTNYLVRKLGGGDSTRDMLWLMWLVYLMPPWYGAVVTFVQALTLFLMLRIFFAKRWMGSP